MTEAKKKAKGFFALDVDQMFEIRARNLGIEEAATYLALMKGTDEGNATSRGGVNSVTEYTGLTRAEAKRAIGHLERIGLVEALDVERARARTVPRYHLPAHESRPRLTDTEAKAVKRIEAGEEIKDQKGRNAAHRAAQKGWIERLSDGWAVVPASRNVAFVPNAFVQMPDQVSPLARLVQAGDLGPILLACELYHKQDLMNERGVPISDLCAFFHTASTVNPGAHGSGYKVHLIAPGRAYMEDGEEKRFDAVYERSAFRASGEAFWSDLRALDRAHVIEWAIYSANGNPRHIYDRLRPQRPLGVLRNGKQVQKTPEAEAAFVAYHILIEHVAERQGSEVPELATMINNWRDDSDIVAIENAHVAQVQAIGICRMVHRADTENTRQWFRDLHQERNRAVFFLDQARRAIFPQASALPDKISTSEESAAAISMKINACST